MDLGKEIRELDVEPLQWPGELPQHEETPVTVPTEEEVAV